MAEPAAVTPTRQIVAPWARFEDHPRNAPPAHDPIYDELLWQASETLYHLSGRQWSGEATREVLLAPYRAGRCWTQTDRLRAASWPSPGAGLLVDAGTRRDGWSTLQLPDPPVVAVEEITLDDAALPADEWEAQLPAGFLRRTEGEWPGRGVRVRYRHGLAPPAGGRLAAILLTTELGKAWSNDKDCRLPRKTVSVTREGVTIQLDQFDQLDKGRFGIVEIDSWLASVNPHRLQRRSRAWTPDIAGRRLR